MKCRVDIFNEQNRQLVTTGLASLACKIWQAEGTVDAVLHVVLVNDSELMALNKQFLGRDYLTDVIAFPITEADDDSFEGEIYISIDRIFENAKTFAVIPQTELARIVIHGVLHFLGYTDKTPDEKHQMSQREDHYLKLAELETTALSQQEP